MGDEKKLSAKERIAAIQAQREALRDKARDAYEEQKAKDLEAVIDLESNYGPGRLRALYTKYCVDGLPVTIVVKVLESEYYKRHRDRIRGRDQSRKDLRDVSEALDELSRASVVYPDRETFAKMLEAFPQAIDSINVMVSKLCDLDEEEEKKG